MINLDKIPLSKYNYVIFKVKLTLKELKKILNAHFEHHLQHEFENKNEIAYTLIVYGISSWERCISVFDTHDGYIKFKYGFYDSEHYSYSSIVFANAIAKYGKLYYI